jgi:hypothetical protein
MATLTWNGSGSGLWTSAINWWTGQPPTAADTALFVQPGNHLIKVTTPVVVAGAILDDPGAALDVTASLTVTNSLVITAGALDVTGSLDATNLANAGTIDNTGFMVLRGSVDLGSLQRISGGGVLEVLGTIDNNGATLDAASIDQTVACWGTLDGGTVVSPIANATLDNVTLAASATLSGDIVIQDHVSFGPTLTGASLQAPTLTFADDETIDHVAITGVPVLDAVTTLTIGADTSIDAGNRLVLQGNSITSSGTITGISGNGYLGDTANNGTITIRNADFRNAGVIQALDTSTAVTTTAGIMTHADTGSMQLLVSGSDFENLPGGLIQVAQAAGSALLSVSATTDFTNDGTVSDNAGTIDIAADLNGSGTLIVAGGGTVTLEGAVSAAQTIAFNGPGTLVLDQAAFVPAAIQGFDASDVLILNGLSANAISYQAGDLRLDIGGGVTFDLGVSGGYTLSDFAVVQVGQDTDIILNPTAVLCMAAGTRIATPSGHLPVETLAAGDLVQTFSGNSQPISWVGYRRVDCQAHPKPTRVWPIRIAPHAFGQGQPARPLLLSPDHAIFVDEVLIPVKLLVNGTTIVQRQPATIDYYHLELAKHDILLADGLAIESYLETGFRAAFANGGPVMQLHPEFAGDPQDVATLWEAYGYAPLVLAPSHLAPIRARLACQATMLAQNPNPNRTVHRPRPRHGQDITA